MPDSELEEIEIYEDDKQVIRIAADLPSNDKDSLINLIKQYKEVFARSPTDMPGIDAKVACHKLSIDPNIKPIQQKKRNHRTEQQRAIEDEVNKLL